MPAYKMAKVAGPGAFKRSGHFLWCRIFGKAQKLSVCHKLVIVIVIIKQQLPAKNDWFSVWISLSEDKIARIKSTTKANFFPICTVVSQAFYNSLQWQWSIQSYSVFQFPTIVHFSKRSKSSPLWTQQISSLNDCKATRKARTLQAPMEGGKLGAKHTHRCGFCIIFLTCQKTSFAILIGQIIFFTWEKTSFASLIAKNSFVCENLRHSFSVSVSQYVYIKDDLPYRGSQWG